MIEHIKALQLGCGPIGRSIAKLAASRSNIDIVGAVDPALAGRDVAEVFDDRKLNGMKISGDARATIERTSPDIVLHATSSSLEQVMPQFEQILDFGVDIVSTCEEMSYPFFHQPRLSRKLDELARQNGATILANGVNPGFLMDVWPVFMTGVVQDVESIVCIRLQDAAHRRLPFQKKIGAGLSVDDFQQRVANGKIRHVGLPESVAMIAAGLGFRLDDVAETIEPVIATRKVSSTKLSVAAGQVAGVRQVANGIVAGAEVIRLEFNAYIGAQDPYDAVHIKGMPDLDVVIKGGVHGDLATASAVVNVVPRAINAPPGLKTMIDIPPAAAFR
ncbi:NAD(P)H-dependent amine dehydrogenase family protein [Candidatus Foliamicus sp.]